MAEWLHVLIIATISAITTGLGPVPLIWIDEVSDRVLALGSAVAAGLMLAASFRLVSEGLTYGELRTIAGIVAGMVFILASKRWLSEREPEIGELQGAGAVKALLFLGAMTLHSFAEGISVGVAFGGSETFGIFIAAAIGIHNIPEGIAIGIGLVPKGMKWWKACLWSIFSSLPQPMMAVPAFLFVAYFEPALPVGLGLAAGAMIWMIASELLPNALEGASPSAVATTVTLSVAAMIGMQVLLDA